MRSRCSRSGPGSQRPEREPGCRDEVEQREGHAVRMPSIVVVERHDPAIADAPARRRHAVRRRRVRQEPCLPASASNLRPRSTSSAYRKNDGSKPPSIARHPAGAGAPRRWPTPRDADRARVGVGPARLASARSPRSGRFTNRKCPMADRRPGCMPALSARSVPAPKSGRDRTCSRMRPGERHERGQGGLLDLCVRVQQEPPLAGRNREALVAGSAEADVRLVGDDCRVGCHAEGCFRRAISRGVVDEDDLEFRLGMFRRRCADRRQSATTSRLR